MPDFVTLSCPTCGGQLQITQDIDRFACAHCGNEHVVNRGGGIITLAPVVEGLDDIRRGTDRTAAELKIRRLKEEISGTEEEVLALAYKLVMSDYPLISATLRKAKSWYSLPPRIRKFDSSDPATVRGRQELIAGFSTASMEGLRLSYEMSSGWLKKPKKKTVAMFEPIIRLKRRIDDKRSEIDELKRDLAADE